MNTSSTFLQACARQPVAHTPVWLMRQAGRYMPEYRELRAKHDMLEMIQTPELAAEVTLQPIRAFDLDAAIIFADILPPLMAMGLDLEFVKGVGPRIGNPIASPADVGRLEVPSVAEALSGTLKAIELVSRELAPSGVPLIGFAGAPFTLACYAIEGGTSRNYAKAKSFMFSEPRAWDQLMTRLVEVQAEYLLEQVGAGASALQVFDSWAGMALGRLDYVRYVQPYNARLFYLISHSGVPVINFSTGTGQFLPDVAACGGSVVGVDWRVPLDWAWKRIGADRAIQGNLDPISLLAPWPMMQERVDDVLHRAGGRPGHIFNLGHGILPDTPMDAVRRLVDYVHEQTSDSATGA